MGSNIHMDWLRRFYWWNLQGFLKAHPSPSMTSTPISAGDVPTAAPFETTEAWKQARQVYVPLNIALLAGFS